jgi:hypothetical protein
VHPSVSAAWPKVAREHEGVCAWPYADTRGLVTTGIGSLFDDGTGTPPEAFLALPWTSGGVPATRAAIASGWLLTKARTDLAPRGGYAFRDVTTLRLDAATITRLLMERTQAFWAILGDTLPNLEAWPADAQLSLIDMAYQLGPRFLGSRWPNFTAGAQAGDFARCAQNCSVSQASGARNAFRIRGFTNAARVVSLGLSPSRLWLDETPEGDELSARVAFRGGWTCDCVAISLPWVEADMIRRGLIKYNIDIAQLGWRGDVGASAGTHDEGGATDTWGQWNTEAIDVWRLWGWTMQRRDLTGVNTHAHGWPWGCTHLAPAAQQQAEDWERGLNGLAYPSKVVGRWPVKHWRQALEENAVSLTDDIAAAAAEKTYQKIWDNRGPLADTMLTRELKLSNKSEGEIAAAVWAARIGTEAVNGWTGGHLVDWNARATATQGEALTRIIGVLGQLVSGQDVAQADLDDLQATLAELTTDEPEPEPAPVPPVSVNE